jgi:enoyl-CoA hydratase/carnithine racemase
MGAGTVRPLDDLVTVLTEPDACTRVGLVRDVPVLVVDARDVSSFAAAPSNAADAVVLRSPAAASLPVVLVGVGAEPGDPSCAACDVVVAGEAEAAAVVAAVEANPSAATVLVQLLRLQAHLPPHDALAAESLAYATLQGGDEFARWLARRGTRVRRPDHTPRVRVEHTDHGRRAVVTLDRPRLFNLYDARMRDELVDAMTALVHDPTVEIVELRGAGKAFCAGGDLGEFGTTRDTTLAHLIRSGANVAPLLLAVAPKLQAFVHGAAVGAGCELAAFASQVVATPDATFALPEVAMGLVPGAGGTVSVARRVGRRRTAWMALTGATVDAPTAHAWGLVDELVPALR